MENKEFNIEARQELFRVSKMTPSEILSLSMTLDLDNYKKTKELFDFVFEHCEVKMGDKWNSVKTRDREVYMPLGIENDIKALQEIVDYFLKEVLAKAF